MKRINRYLVLIAVSCISIVGNAQKRSCGLWLNEVPLVADSTAGRMYATLEPEADYALKGTMRWDGEVYQSVVLNGNELSAGQGNFSVNDWSDRTVNTLTLTDRDGSQREWKMVFTTLPLVLIESDQKELYELWKRYDHDIKYPSSITVIDARFRTEGMAEFYSNIGIHVRGVTSAGKPKKCFAIELWDEEGEELDVHLLGYRNDGDWILDAMYSDHSRMRNRLTFDIWNAIDDLPYEKDNQYQCNGTQGEFVEVFTKGKYNGLYCFTDKIDRKKLNLKKTKEATETSEEETRGLLWKAKFRCSETTFYDYDELPTNDTLVWPLDDSPNRQEYWMQEYPSDRQDQAYFDPILHAIDIVGKDRSSNTVFADSVENLFYFDNVINFVICSQVFQWMDNLQKNYFLSIRNIKKDSRMLITPWDLDATLGRNAGGDKSVDDKKWMAWGEQLGGINCLVWRLKERRPNDFATRLNDRWQYLKTHELSIENIRKRMMKYGDLFTNSGAWEREKEYVYDLIGGKDSGKDVKIDGTVYEEIDFICDFLEKNYAKFEEKVASWKPSEYTEPKLEENALYVVGYDSIAEFEGNVATVPGKVTREPVEGIVSVDFKDTEMIVQREEGTVSYDANQIREVTTQRGEFYPTNAFVPEEYLADVKYDTHYGNPVPEDMNAFKTAPAFPVQRSLRIEYDGGEAKVVGNVSGFNVVQDGASVSIESDLEGVNYILAGTSDCARISINGTEKMKITLDNARLGCAEGAALTCTCSDTIYLVTGDGTENELSGINAGGNIALYGEGVLRLVADGDNSSLVESAKGIEVNGGVINMFNSGNNGKGLFAKKNIVVNGGSIHIITTGESNYQDDSLDEQGATAVHAAYVTVNGGEVFVKTVGKNGGVGVAATGKLAVNGGKMVLTTFDDPINAVDGIEINGGEVFGSSMVDDGMDCNGSIKINGGKLFVVGAYPNESAFDNDGKTFAVNGGSVVGIGYKSDAPQASRSAQASICVKKTEGVKRFVRIATEEGEEVMRIETPAYGTSTLVCSSPELEKGKSYVIEVSEDGEKFEELVRLKAE